MIVLDANVVIAFLDANDPHQAASLELLERHFVDGFGCSVLTLAEVRNAYRLRMPDAVALLTAMQFGAQLATFDAALAAAAEKAEVGLAT